MPDVLDLIIYVCIFALGWAFSAFFSKQPRDYKKIIDYAIQQVLASQVAHEIIKKTGQIKEISDEIHPEWMESALHHWGDVSKGKDMMGKKQRQKNGRFARKS